jgi:cobalt-zinc-cadmium efflux system protein
MGRTSIGSFSPPLDGAGGAQAATEGVTQVKNAQPACAVGSDWPAGAVVEQNLRLDGLESMHPPSRKPGHVGHYHGASADRAGHGHAGREGATSTRRLRIALGLTAGFLVVEAVAGFLTGSLALLSDAGHMLTDVAALALALYAQALAARARTGRHTFGFRRAEILAALINGIVLGAGAVWVIVEAVHRFRDPPALQGPVLLVVAALGLVVNVISAFVLSREPARNVNVRAALAHVLADAAGSVAAIVAGVLILTLGLHLADPLASIAISLLILLGAWRLVRESVDVLMEGVPRSIDVAQVEKVVRDTPGVSDLHDLHVWSVSEGFPVVTVHVVLSPGYHGTDIARAVAMRIEQRLGITHLTVQPEPPDVPLVPAHAITRDRH